MIQTERLIIRPCTMDDVDDYLLFWNDPEVMKFIGDGTWGGGRDVVTEVLRKNIAMYQHNPDLGFWAVCEKTNEQLIGEAGLALVADTAEIEAGYILAQKYWRQGFGTEILRGLLNYGFSTLGLKEIIAVAHPDNVASTHIMKKCGMSFVGQAIYHNRMSDKYIKKRAIRLG